MRAKIMHCDSQFIYMSQELKITGGMKNFNKNVFSSNIIKQLTPLLGDK